MASTPCSRHRRASSPVTMPLTSRGTFTTRRSSSSSVHSYQSLPSGTRYGLPRGRGAPMVVGAQHGAVRGGEVSVMTSDARRRKPAGPTVTTIAGNRRLEPCRASGGCSRSPAAGRVGTPGAGGRGRNLSTGKVATLLTMNGVLDAAVAPACVSASAPGLNNTWRAVGEIIMG